MIAFHERGRVPKRFVLPRFTTLSAVRDPQLSGKLPVTFIFISAMVWRATLLPVTSDVSAGREPVRAAPSMMRVTFDVFVQSRYVHEHQFEPVQEDDKPGMELEKSWRKASVLLFCAAVRAANTLAAVAVRRSTTSASTAAKIV